MIGKQCPQRYNQYIQQATSRMLPILQIEQEILTTQPRVVASSSNLATESQEDRFFKSLKILNAYEEFEKDMVKDKTVPRFDLRLDDEAHTQGLAQREPISTTQSNKDNLYADDETEDLVHSTVNLVQLQQTAKKEQQG